MKLRALFLFIIFNFLFSPAGAQVEIPKDTPQLEFALQLKVTLSEAYSCGETQHGRRTIIPITGGTFEGPNIKGTIVNGGADYQIANSAGRTELEAIYCIKTDDGVYIHIRNRGIIANGKDENGNPSFYSSVPHNSRLPATANMRGSTIPSSFVRHPSHKVFRASSSTSGASSDWANSLHPNTKIPHCKCSVGFVLWALTDSNRRPSACKADALNQLS